jgi:hypothetical protein
MPSSNPLSIEQLFDQLQKDLTRHFNSRSGMAAVTLRINSYSRLIKAHPENTHDNPRIPSTAELREHIDEWIEVYGTYHGSGSHALGVKVYTRIIAGRK